MPRGRGYKSSKSRAKGRGRSNNNKRKTVRNRGPKRMTKYYQGGGKF